MAIKLDNNRRTYRSDVKSRSGKRLYGLEAHYQGLDLLETNVSRGLLPIIGREGSGYDHEYDQVQAVYKSVKKISTEDSNRVIDLTIAIEPGVSTFNDGSSSSKFTNLEGQTFTIFNPFYGAAANTGPISWTFEYTGTSGADPRRFFVENGLYTGWDQNWRSGGSPKDFLDLRFHPLNVHYYTDNPDWRAYRDNASPNGNKVEFDLYGSQLSNGNYAIPLGFPNQTFQDLVKSITGLSSYTNQFVEGTNEPFLLQPANFDFTAGEVYRELASTPTWLQVITERAIRNVLPNYVKILCPTDKYDGQKLPIGVSYGPMSGLWDHFRRVDSDPNSRNPARIKLYYNPDYTDGYVNVSISNNATSGADVALSNWKFLEEYEYVYEGNRVVEKNPRIFYEDFRHDYLRQTFNQGSLTYGPNPVYKDNMYPVQTSKGTSKPSMAAGAPLVKMDERIAALSAAAKNDVIVGELVTISKTQSRTALYNSFANEYKYYEDVHYVDPDQQNWTELLHHKMWSQWVNPNDHATEQAAFVQHLTNMFDGVYARVELIPEHPMSGRIDVFDRINSFYENTPQRILENSRNVVGATLYVDREAFRFRCTDAWPKKVESTPVKMFEDLRGIRNEGRLHEYWEIYVKDTVYGLVNGQEVSLKGLWIKATKREIISPVQTHIDGTNMYKYTLVVGDVSATNQPFKPLVIQASEKGNGGDYSGLKHYPAITNLFVGEYINGNTERAVDYIFDGSGNTIGYSDDNSVMFNDFFDQRDPAYLKHVEEERWSPIDEQMIQIQSGYLWDHDNNDGTPKQATNRKLILDRREWQDDDYLYANTGHTTIHSERSCGTIWQEYKR